MVQDGWLVSPRVGRATTYALTERGSDLVDEGRGSIFAEPEESWYVHVVHRRVVSPRSAPRGARPHASGTELAGLRLTLERPLSQSAQPPGRPGASRDEARRNA